MGRRSLVGIKPGGLHLQTRDQVIGELLLKPRDLRFIQIRQHGERHHQLRGVVTVEPGSVERQWLAQLPADLGDEIVGDAQPRLRAHLLDLVGCEGELFPLNFRQRTVQFFLLRGDGLFLHGQRLFAQYAVSRVELFPQVVEIQAQVVTRTVLGQHAAFAVENFPAHRRQPHGAVGLRLQMALVFLRRDDLHPPQAREQKTQPGQQHDRHEAELRVVLF